MCGCACVGVRRVGGKVPILESKQGEIELTWTSSATDEVSEVPPLPRASPSSSTSDCMCVYTKVWVWVWVCVRRVGGKVIILGSNKEKWANLTRHHPVWWGVRGTSSPTSDCLRVYTKVCVCVCVCVLGLGYINRTGVKRGERRTYTQSQKLLECRRLLSTSLRTTAQASVQTSLNATATSASLCWSWCVLHVH